MKIRFLQAALLISIATMVQGCAAAIPFLPALAALPGLLMTQVPSGKKAETIGDTKPIERDPAIQQAISAPAAIPGDAGMLIAQQDRVAFQPAAEGSIPLRVGAVDIVSDLKAHAVGDIVTVNVVESMSSESKAQTSLAKKNSISAGMPNLLSGTEWLSKHYPLLNTSSLFSGSADNSTTGSGDMSAGDTFTATVSSIVVAVNPSGTLSIKGDRHVRVNGENDTIRLSGVVRPEDLDSNNMVSSTLVAELEVSMTGQGEIRDKQGNGMGTRVFDWLWPF
jgi:flagellar L-ring protein precursor FlgH